MTNTSGFDFNCTIGGSAQAITVSWRLRNISGAEAGVFNHIQGLNLDDTLCFDSDLVYVDFADGLLRLSKRPLPVPEGLAMAETVEPFVSRLPTAGDIEERFTLPTPVRVANPLRRADLAADDPQGAVVADMPVEANAIQFEVAAFRVRPETKLRFLPVSPAFPHVHRYWPPALQPDDMMLFVHRTELRAPLAVLDYRLVPGVQQQ